MRTRSSVRVTSNVKFHFDNTLLSIIITGKGTRYATKKSCRDDGLSKMPLNVRVCILEQSGF